MEGAVFNTTGRNHYDTQRTDSGGRTGEKNCLFTENLPKEIVDGVTPKC